MVDFAGSPAKVHAPRAAATAPMPDLCSAVEEADGAGLECHADFQRLMASREVGELGGGLDRPLVLRAARMKPSRYRDRDWMFKDFTLQTLAKHLPGVPVPQESQRGTGAVSSSLVSKSDNCRLAAGKPSRFKDFVENLGSGASDVYLRVGSASDACSRSSTGQESITHDSEGADLLLTELVRRAPVPRIVPHGKRFATVFWIGSQNKRGLLHTDLFTEQYFVQNEGVKGGRLKAGAHTVLDKQEVPPVQAPVCLQYELVRGRVPPDDAPARGRAIHTTHVVDEFRAASAEPSLSTSIRVHLPREDKAFHNVVKSCRQLHKKLLERGSERLMAHVTSFLFHGMLLGLSSAPRARLWSMTQRATEKPFNPALNQQSDAELDKEAAAFMDESETEVPTEEAVPLVEDEVQDTADSALVLQDVEAVLGTVRLEDGSEYEKFWSAERRLPYWYNEDSGELVWSLQKLTLEASERARQRRAATGSPERAQMVPHFFLDKHEIDDYELCYLPSVPTEETTEQTVLTEEAASFLEDGVQDRTDSALALQDVEAALGTVILEDGSEYEKFWSADHRLPYWYNEDSDSLVWSLQKLTLEVSESARQLRAATGSPRRVREVQHFFLDTHDIDDYELCYLPAAPTDMREAPAPDHDEPPCPASAAAHPGTSLAATEASAGCAPLGAQTRPAEEGTDAAAIFCPHCGWLCRAAPFEVPDAAVAAG
eukprot:CAMPEP_0179189452 /NCGR_PEP_ID=MMETSP0796-20121207/94049_1 /TAXON_ID=73915 /ORGANISM="Pyrodinium bahamense, Strain pbaha01" /LENGTH=712 /DNA_ID=CAMNT_0020893587 /DNA_START=50 /DNA_END=2190 /DNA_ORIENTATION=+